MTDLISRQELLNRTVNNPLHPPYITERDVLDCPLANAMDDKMQSRIERVLFGKTPEEQYDILYWLMMEYGKGHNNSRLARIEWLKQKDDNNHER